MRRFAVLFAAAAAVSAVPCGVRALAGGGAEIIINGARIDLGDRGEPNVDRQLVEVEQQIRRLKGKAEEDPEAAEKLEQLQAHQKMLRAAQRKLRAAHEKALQRARNWAEKHGAVPQGAQVLPFLQPGNQNRPQDVGVVDVPLNPRDAAHFEVARLLSADDRHEDAVDELRKVVDHSPDAQAVSAAHFSIANLSRRHLGDPDAAIEHYALVQGDLQDAAVRAMIETFEELGEIDRAAQFLEQLVTKAQDKVAKVRLLNQLADLHRRDGDDEKAIATLRRIPELISYEEAEAMREKIRPPQPARVDLTVPGQGAPWVFQPFNDGAKVFRREGAVEGNVIILKGGKVEVRHKKGDRKVEADEIRIREKDAPRKDAPRRDAPRERDIPREK